MPLHEITVKKTVYGQDPRSKSQNAHDVNAVCSVQRDGDVEKDGNILFKKSKQKIADKAPAKTSEQRHAQQDKDTSVFIDTAVFVPSAEPSPSCNPFDQMYQRWEAAGYQLVKPSAPTSQSSVQLDFNNFVLQANTTNKTVNVNSRQNENGSCELVVDMDICNEDSLEQFPQPQCLMSETSVTQQIVEHPITEPATTQHVSSSAVPAPGGASIMVQEARNHHQQSEGDRISEESFSNALTPSSAKSVTIEKQRHNGNITANNEIEDGEIVSDCSQNDKNIHSKIDAPRLTLPKHGPSTSKQSSSTDFDRHPVEIVDLDSDSVSDEIEVVEVRPVTPDTQKQRSARRRKKIEKMACSQSASSRNGNLSSIKRTPPILSTPVFARDGSRVSSGIRKVICDRAPSPIEKTPASVSSTLRTSEDHSKTADDEAISAAGMAKVKMSKTKNPLECGDGPSSSSMFIRSAPSRARPGGPLQRPVNNSNEALTAAILAKQKKSEEAKKAYLQSQREKEAQAQKEDLPRNGRQRKPSTSNNEGVSSSAVGCHRQAETDSAWKQKKVFIDGLFTTADSPPSQKNEKMFKKVSDDYQEKAKKRTREESEGEDDDRKMERRKKKKTRDSDDSESSSSKRSSKKHKEKKPKKFTYSRQIDCGIILSDSEDDEMPWRLKSNQSKRRVESTDDTDDSKRETKSKSKAAKKDKSKRTKKNVVVESEEDVELLDVDVYVEVPKKSGARRRTTRSMEEEDAVTVTNIPAEIADPEAEPIHEKEAINEVFVQQVLDSGSVPRQCRKSPEKSRNSSISGTYQSPSPHQEVMSCAAISSSTSTLDGSYDLHVVRELSKQKLDQMKLKPEDAEKMQKELWIMLKNFENQMCEMAETCEGGLLFRYGAYGANLLFNLAKEHRVLHSAAAHDPSNRDASNAAWQVVQQKFSDKVNKPIELKVLTDYWNETILRVRQGKAKEMDVELMKFYDFSVREPRTRRSRSPCARRNASPPKSVDGRLRVFLPNGEEVGYVQPGPSRSHHAAVPIRQQNLTHPTPIAPMNGASAVPHHPQVMVAPPGYPPVQQNSIYAIPTQGNRMMPPGAVASTSSLVNMSSYVRCAPPQGFVQQMPGAPMAALPLQQRLGFNQQPYARPPPYPAGVRPFTQPTMTAHRPPTTSAAMPQQYTPYTQQHMNQQQRMSRPVVPPPMNTTSELQLESDVQGAPLSAAQYVSMLQAEKKKKEEEAKKEEGAKKEIKAQRKTLHPVVKQEECSVLKTLINENGEPGKPTSYIKPDPDRPVEAHHQEPRVVKTPSEESTSVAFVAPEQNAVSEVVRVHAEPERCETSLQELLRSDDSQNRVEPPQPAPGEQGLRELLRSVSNEVPTPTPVSENERVDVRAEKETTVAQEVAADEEMEEGVPSPGSLAVAEAGSPVVEAETIEINDNNAPYDDLPPTMPMNEFVDAYFDKLTEMYSERRLLYFQLERQMMEVFRKYGEKQGNQDF
ncbi:hypothetical protein QR680_008700 [Steinernema hermaphroditum]|uniref:Uncharacterized protein n=1 Tax=Steinernema hermaphroditum TaxID=289476 RepID=A0AA39IHK9_9BILA|nr:hypothetical protein QR680_008700 [Steinernema hermaphroditum]